VAVVHAATASRGQPRGGRILRYVYIALIVLFTVLVLTFKVQNVESATLVLLSMSITLPMSVIVLLVYILGMLSGGFVLQLLSTWVRKARPVAIDRR
jgi:putative membrane protein